MIKNPKKLEGEVCSWKSIVSNSFDDVYWKLILTMSEEYDEFGNYIGDLKGDSYGFDEFGIATENTEDMEENEAENADEVDAMEIEARETGTQAIVLAEDKKYYPDAEEVYPEAETILQEEDTQPITEPIIAPVKTMDFDLVEKSMPETSFDYNFLAG